jgi:flagella basal body P-ring formation protein FlgA
MRLASTSLGLALALSLAGAALAPAVARADVADQIRAEIDAGLPPDLRVVEVRVPMSLAGAGTDAITIDWRRGARPGWMTLRVRAGQRSGWVRARLAALAPTVVATRDLPVGLTIGQADVRIELVPVVGASSAVAGVEGVIGRALRQPVAAGAPVPAGALEQSAPLPRGHEVTALIRRGNLSISAAGTLERPAAIGQATSVRLRATGRVVRGRLIDSHSVLIEVSP